jgi:hypothetical protein
MLQMRHEGGPHLDEQGFEVRVLRARDQCLVHCIEDGLVIDHLMVHISTIECGATELLEIRQILLASLLQALAGGLGSGVTCNRVTSSVADLFTPL